MNGGQRGRKRRPQGSLTDELAIDKLAREVEARRVEPEEPEPPPGLVMACGGWWPENWELSAENTSDQVLCALGRMLKLAYSHPRLSDVERSFYLEKAHDVRRVYDLTRRYAAERVEQLNADYAERCKA